MLGEMPILNRDSVSVSKTRTRRSERDGWFLFSPQPADVQNCDADVAHAIEAAADAGAAAGAREATGGIPAELAAAATSCRVTQTSAAYATADDRRGCSAASIASMCPRLLRVARHRHAQFARLMLIRMPASARKSNRTT